MRSDYQLKHHLYGKQGTLWERQVDPDTRNRLRGIVESAGGSALLASLDVTAAAVTRRPSVLAEDVYFQFNSGNFAVVGRQQREYVFASGEVDEKRLHFAYREGEATTLEDGTPTILARVSNDFMRAIQSTNLTVDRDWYLVPIPRGVTPVVIEGKDADTFLVNGVDFIAHPGYIAMTDDPEQVLPVGVVRVNAAWVETVAPAVGSLMDPGRPGVGRYLAEYAKKSQSLLAFQRAAAEYAGLYVTQAPDVVLRVVDLGGGHTAYHLADAGVIEIRYPHIPLTVNQALPAGFIVSGRFEVVASRYGGTTNLKAMASASWGHPIRLDGILPVNGLTWDGRSGVVIDSVSSGPGGKPHLRLHFDGSEFNRGRLWEFQRLYELRTGAYLYDALSGPALPSVIDFWDLLETFYGAQLFLLLFDDHSPRINVRLWRFATEQRPQGANMLLGNDLGVDESELEKDPRGFPLLDETGENYYSTGGLDGYDNYFRPDGVGLYIRPFGAGYYLRPD